MGASADAVQASVVVTTYNDSAILESTLAAFAVQSASDFELVIADDGSREDYSATFERWARRFRDGITHVWHEDKGFRRARILNGAIRTCRAARIVFSDADCLPHRDFVRNHLAYLEPGIVITGRRVHIAREAVPAPEEILHGGLKMGMARLILLRFQGRAQRIEHGIVSPILYEASRNGILGSNCSIGREDLEAVNGFSAEFEGWGGEDTDLAMRLARTGVRVRNLRNKVVQYHVRHAQRNEDTVGWRALMDRYARENVTRAPEGLAEIREGDFEVRRYPR
ncbi:MAG: glycosyltransferase [Candidatus Acidiferrales bacterium]